MNTALGRVCLYRKRLYSAALRQLDATSNWIRTLSLVLDRARVLQARGELPQALSGYMHAFETSGNSAAVLAELGHCQAAMGDIAAARETLERFGVVDAQLCFGAGICHLYHGLGEKQLFLDELHKAVKERTRGLVWLAVDPRFDDMHENPEFAAIVAEMGLAGRAA